MKLVCDVCGHEPVEAREDARCDITAAIDAGGEQRCIGAYRNVEREIDFEKAGQINAFELA